MSCKRCQIESAELTSYWGDPLCRECARHVAQLLDERGCWPDVPWSDDDAGVLS